MTGRLAPKSLDSGLWTLDFGLWTLDPGLRSLATFRYKFLQGEK